MQRVKILAIPCGTCVAIAAVPFSKEPPASIVHGSEEKRLVRPSRLPIYTSDEEHSQPKASVVERPPSVMEEGFGTVRRGIRGLLAEYMSATENFNSKISTGYEHSLLMLDYLREESNIAPRLGAVGIGGLTGLVFGLRGGRFKRFVYTSGGALTVAAVCYPKQARDTFALVKHYTNIGYNFVYGVKPGDADQLEIKWPEIPKFDVPSSTSELFTLAVDTGSGLASFVGSLASKATDAITESTSEVKTIAAAVPKPKDH